MERSEVNGKDLPVREIGRIASINVLWDLDLFKYDSIGIIGLLIVLNINRLLYGL